MTERHDPSLPEPDPHTWEHLAETDGSEVDSLLREVAGLRLFLSADLSLAAGAVDEGAYDVAADLIDGDRQALADFEDSVLTRLEAAATADSERLLRVARPSRRARLMRPRPSLVAAAALVGLLGGLLGAPALHHGADRNGGLALSAAAGLAALQDAADGGNATEVRLAAQHLHATLAQLLSTDPDSADQVVQILNSEQQLLLDGAPGGRQVLADARALVAHLRAISSGKVKKALAAALPPTESKPAAQASTSSSPKPSASPSPSPKPSPKPSASPKPSPSPTASPTGLPLPTQPPSVR